MSNFDQTVQTLFEKCLELPSDKWEAFLLSSCPDDPEIRASVLSLVKSHKTTGGFLDSLPVEDVEKVAKRRKRIAASDEREGDQIGRYRLVEMIGEGAWGTVWVAEQTEDIKRQVALKILKLGLDTKDFLTRFEAERQMLAMMDHSNIATVLDAGATDYGRPYLVMELVEGMPLLRYADENQMSVEDRVELFIKICQALQHAHERGIIHRDIKPSNVLVSEQDGRPQPKIIDFGIAKTNQFKLSDKTLFTNIHTFIGTPLYSSPEQLEFSGMDVDPRSDVYSLGALLYQFLSGRTAFELESVSKRGLEKMRSVLMKEDPPLPSVRYSDLTPEAQEDIAFNRNSSPAKSASLLKGDLDWIIMKCLEKDRERRYESADALAQDLKAFLEYRPVSAAAPSALYRTRKFLRRHGIDRNAKILIPTALLGIFGFIFFFKGRTPDSVPGNSDGSGSIARNIPIDERAIAVLPFENLSQNQEDGFFADSLHSEMISAVSGFPDLKTISRVATQAYRGTEKSNATIGEELGVAKLLMGCVQRIDDRLQLNLELVLTTDIQPLWSQEYVREFNEQNLFEIQKEMCSTAAREFYLVLHPEQAPSRSKVPSQNVEALEAYFKAKDIVDSKETVRIEEAITLFEDALELDPQFALAYVGLAKAYSENDTSVARTMSLKERRDKIEEATYKALELDDSLPEVHALIGLNKYLRRDVEGAVASMKRVLALDPNYADAYYNLGRMERVPLYRDPDHFFALQRRFHFAQKAVELEPVDARYRELLASTFGRLGRKSEALMNYRLMAESNPKSSVTRLSLGKALVQNYHRFDEAIVSLRKGLALDPEITSFANQIRTAYRALGGIEEAIAWTERAQSVDPKQGPLYNADLVRFRGNEDEAMKMYRQNLSRSWTYGNARTRVYNDDLRKGNYEESKARNLKIFPTVFTNPRLNEIQAVLASELAGILLAMGETEQGFQLLDKLWDHFKRHPDGHNRDRYEALYLVMKGDHDGSMRVIQRMIQNGHRNREELLDARFDPLRERPDFLALMKIVDDDLTEQLANIRRMEANGELEPIPDLQKVP